MSLLKWDSEKRTKLQRNLRVCSPIVHGVYGLMASVKGVKRVMCHPTESGTLGGDMMWTGDAVLYAWSKRKLLGKLYVEGCTVWDLSSGYRTNPVDLHEPDSSQFLSALVGSWVRRAGL